MRSRLRRLLAPVLPAWRLLRRWPAALRVRRAARQLHYDPQAGVAYLHPGFPAPPPGATERAIGGAVKMSYLAEQFRPSFPSASILYGVSSVYHPDAVMVAREARRNGLRFVLNQNGVYYPAWFGEGWEEYNRPLAALLAQADHVIYQSEFCRRSADRFLGATRGAASVVFNPVDLAHFRPVRRARGRIIMLAAASDASRRDRVNLALSTLARCVAQGHDVGLLLAGYSASYPSDRLMMQQLQHSADRLRVGDRLAFHDRYVRQDAPAVFARADLLLHPVYNDPSPNLVGEALASGLPVAFSASGGTPEIVGPEAGVGVPAIESWDTMHPPEADALAQAVARIADRIDDFAGAARARAEAVLDLPAYVAAHARLFAEQVRA